MMPLFVVLSTCLLLIVLYFKVHYHRFKQYARFPQLPSSLLFGHMKIYHEITQRGSLDRDHDHIFSEIHQSLGCPPLVLLDYRPICRPVVFITSYQIAEQISRATKAFPTSLPKVDLRYLQHIIGSNSILSSEGDAWKDLRKRFNHGFSSQHLSTLLPTMLDKTMIFVKRLEAFSKTGQTVSLVDLAMELTFDIIGAVIMDADLAAQNDDPERKSELYRTFKDLLLAYWDDKIYLPRWLSPRTEIKRRRLGKDVHNMLKPIVRQTLFEQRNRKGNNSRNTERSILSLSLQNVDYLSPAVLDMICDQLKTFLLAGHDTPSATLAWIFYELSRCPRALDAVKSELDGLFGPETDPEAVYKQLVSANGPDLVKRMSYVSAVIKETLRLHTPASTARYSPTGNNFTIHTPQGEELALDDIIVYNCGSIIHRDPSVYGASADMFVPERWLHGGENGPDAEPDSCVPGVPSGAWRPFERGPRGCIGQEFATMELRVIIAVIARKYEFVKLGLGELAVDQKGSPILGDDGQYKVKSTVYNTREITSRPVDGMLTKVRKIS